jgi:hypothetical protein
MQGRQAPNAWRVLALLFLANLFNFFDRTIPAIVVPVALLLTGVALWRASRTFAADAARMRGDATPARQEIPGSPTRARR